MDLEPIATRAGASLGTQISLAAPGPAAVLTGSMNAELNARAVTGGDPGGYIVHCTLDRFAVRVDAGVFGLKVATAMYIDLSCDVERALDHRSIWRGPLRGRGAARGGGLLARERTTVQQLADRMMSDTARELASDLIVRALGLGASSSERVFANEGAHDDFAGTDDTVLGPVALGEKPEEARAISSSLKDPEAATRGSAWNAVGMATGPGDPWETKDEVLLDDEPLVRFYQYKALGRRGTQDALRQLRDAASREGEHWLAEFANDTLATGGIGLPRPTNASSVTSGAATSP